MGKDWSSVQDCIRASLGTDISLLNTVNLSLLSHSGKQLRPILTLLVAKACNSDVCREDTISFASAVELLHNATLLHDDVADQADMRRGCPTVRAMLGPSSSVLVGDFWLVRSLKLVLESRQDLHEKVLKMMSSTLSDLAEGEMFQLQKASTADTTFEDYLKIVYCKTSSIFSLACKCGALSVDAPARYMDAVEEYATYLGYAFQMKDDVFDYQERPQAGKPAGLDILEHKITLPLLKVLEQMSPEQEKQVRGMVTDGTGESRDRIVEMVRKAGGIQMALEASSLYCEKAVAALAPLPESQAKDSLIHIVRYAVSRDK